jgi:hypothetical protein
MHWIDPEHLPSTDGEIERFVVNPRGEIDGLVLHGGTRARRFRRGRRDGGRPQRCRP